MTANPALSVRAAVERVRRTAPDSWHQCDARVLRDSIAGDFAERFAGVPATTSSREEKVVRYRVAGCRVPVLLGLYGSERRVRDWLPGLPERFDHAGVEELLAAVLPATAVTDPPCQQRPDLGDLDALPVLRATARDAGRYLTMGLVYARGSGGAVALSVHRMLVLDGHRLAIWMVPSRRLRALHEDAVRENGRLAVSINIGAPPAAVVASALTSSVLPSTIGKLDLAGALAGAPVTLAPALSQATEVLAESEIVVEGYLDDQVADEGDSGVSLPEFLGYDGDSRTGLPVVTVTAVTGRRSPLYQAVIGPGREQSVVLGLAGSLSVLMAADGTARRLVRDLHYSAAGGGMLLLVIAVRKESAADDRALAPIARRIFEGNPFVKLIVFTDDDIDIGSPEDLLWAITTRTNLGADCVTLDGFRPLAMDPSQSADWASTRGPADGTARRSFVDATIPHDLRSRVTRSFPAPVYPGRTR